MTENELTTTILGLAIKVHRTLGPRILENVYQECLCYELIKKGLTVEKEKRLPVWYDGVEIDCNYRIDLLVENKVIIELKSVSELAGIHTAQVITYPRLGNFRLGLLINFNEELLRNGIRRIVNNM